MAEVKLWNQFEGFDHPSNLTSWDKCIYAREYVSHGKYDASEANDLIQNFKIKPQHLDTPRWRHKVRVIQKFAQELAQVIGSGWAVTAIPPSKPQGHPEYDPRFDMLFEALGKLRPDLTFVYPIVRNVASSAAHESDQRPSITEIIASLHFDGFPAVPPTYLVFVDDVVTSGKHFTACERMINNFAPTIRVFGAFWAKTIWPAGDGEED